MNPSSRPASDFMPHGPEMTLIDSLVESSVTRSIALVEITETSLFVEHGAVPAWVGVEYMAQTIAARAGFEARLRGGRPVIGFLLGTRRYTSAVAEFPIGTRLRIVVEPLFVEEGFGSFSCVIESDSIIAEAVLNTFRPTDQELAALLEGSG